MHINKNKNHKIINPKSSFFGFNASMLACYHDNVDILEITLKYEYKNSLFKNYTYIEKSLFMMPPKSSLLHLCIVCSSSKCLKYIIKQMRKD